MTAKRYAVIDENGVKVNSIAADEDAAKAGTCWPGYGAGLVLEGDLPEDPPPVSQPPKDPGFRLFDVTPSAPMNVGDAIDLQTGKVTPKPVDLVDAGGIVDAQI